MRQLIFVAVLACSTQAVATTALSADELVARFWETMDERAPEVAVARLRAQVAQDDPLAMVQIGHALLRIMDYDSAQAVWRAVTALTPDDAQAHGYLGQAAYWNPLGGCAEALPAYNAALRLAPTHSSAGRWHLGAGLCLLSQREPQAAYEACATAKALGETHPRVTSCLARASFLAGEYAQALEHFDTLARAPGSAGDARAGRVASLARLGQQDAASALVQDQCYPPCPPLPTEEADARIKALIQALEAGERFPQ